MFSKVAGRKAEVPAQQSRAQSRDSGNEASSEESNDSNSEAAPKSVEAAGEPVEQGGAKQQAQRTKREQGLLDLGGLGPMAGVEAGLAIELDQGRGGRGEQWQGGEVSLWRVLTRYHIDKFNAWQDNSLISVPEFCQATPVQWPRPW